MSKFNKNLKAINIVKAFKSKIAVNNISLNVKPKTITAILGPNGSGKTTLFSIITGVIKASKGSVFFGDEDITLSPINYRARMGIGYLTQESSIFKNLTVSENIMFALQIRYKNIRIREKKLSKLLVQLNISHIKDSLGMSLSGGERRRVEVARCLALEPRFILFDEPFAGVDPVAIDDIKNLIKDVAKLGPGILITDHNVYEMINFASYFYILAYGNLLCEGDKNKVINDKQVRKLYLGENFNL